MIKINSIKSDYIHTSTIAITVSVKFRCATVDCAILTPNSQNCVALMVSAPIYVAQKQMSY